MVFQIYWKAIQLPFSVRPNVVHYLASFYVTKCARLILWNFQLVKFSDYRCSDKLGLETPPHRPPSRGRPAGDWRWNYITDIVRNEKEQGENYFSCVWNILKILTERTSENQWISLQIIVGVQIDRWLQYIIRKMQNSFYWFIALSIYLFIRVQTS